MSALPVGIHDGVPMRDYLLHHGFSASRAHTLLTYSPFHAYHDEGGEPSTASEVGTAIHDALLEGVNRIAVIDPQEYPGKKGGIPDGWTNDAIRAARDKARGDGKIPLLPSAALSVHQAVSAAKRFVESSEIAGVFERGRPEQTILWKEGEMLCKARPDWLSIDVNLTTMLHVKTTQGSAEPNAWIRNMLTSMGYDVAWALYERGLAEHDGIGAKDFRNVFLVIEANPPYGCSLIGLDPAMADLAHRKVERAIRTWQQCKASGKYPAYPSRICYAAPKPWELAAEEETELTGAYDELQEKEGLQA